MNKMNTLIEHPNKFNPSKNDRFKWNLLAWSIFPVSENIDQYLEKLPGFDYLELISEEEEMGRDIFSKEYLEKAIAKGNGHAMYTQLDQFNKENLIKSAKFGSPDAFVDLISEINEKNDLSNFVNTSLLDPLRDKDFFSRIDCMLYLYTLMERLGISFYDPVNITAKHLEADTESSYKYLPITMKELKYRLCDHKHIILINNRASSWNLGLQFDQEFMSKISSIDFSICN